MIYGCNIDHRQSMIPYNAQCQIITAIVIYGIFLDMEIYCQILYFLMLHV